VSERTCLDTVLAEYLDKDDRITFKFVIDLALAELATLRAKAEAWDKVAFLYPLADGPVLCAEFDEQIERIKNLTPPARGEGTTFQSGDVDGTNPPPSEGQET